MKTNASIYFFVLIICTLVLFSCENKTKKSSVKKSSKIQEKVDAKQTKKETEKITNKNVVEKLEKYFRENKERKVILKTRFGTITIQLYDDTPLHTANFLMLTKTGYYDDTFFDRVVKGFVIQGGNSDDPFVQIKQQTIGDYSIPAEIKPHLIHKKGAVAMARSYHNNPEKRSAAYEFYIVHGTKFSDKELKYYEKTNNKTFSKEHKQLYKTIGGAAHLDGEHTVFGEVIDGLNIIDSIANVQVDDGDWPIEDVVIKMEVYTK